MHAVTRVSFIHMILLSLYTGSPGAAFVDLLLIINLSPDGMLLVNQYSALTLHGMVSRQKDKHAVLIKLM